jgi:hypothetical protein
VIECLHPGGECGSRAAEHRRQFRVRARVWVVVGMIENTRYVDGLLCGDLDSLEHDVAAWSAKRVDTGLDLLPSEDGEPASKAFRNE